MDNEELYNEAVEAINRLFSDNSVSRMTARTNLRSLIGEIQVLLEALDVDEEIDEIYDEFEDE